MSDNADFEIRILGEEEGGAAPGEMMEILNEEQAKEAMDYLKGEYDAASTEMDARNQKLIKWRRNMEAIASDAPKQHPFKNSSNVTIPVTQVLTQNLISKIKGTFDARKPLWTIEDSKKDEESGKVAKVIQKYMNILAAGPYDLNMEEVLQDLVSETVLTGGAFPKVVYAIESWRVKEAGGEGEKEVVWHDGPAVVVTPLEKCKYRRGISKVARLPWIALDTTMTEHELREKASKGIYNADAVAEVLKSQRTTPTDTEEQLQQAESFDSGEMTPLFDISEVWFYWDVDGSGVPVDLFFTVHMPSGQVLKQQYNTLGARFVVPSRYVHRPFGLVGRGTGQMTESMQDEVTSIHNMRLDNMKLANMRMIAVKRASGFGGKREIFPGAIWEMDNPAEDVRPIQLGEVYPSSLQNESQGWGIAQKASGMSDSQMGFADSTMGTRDTARGQAMRLEKGDSILGGIVEGLKTTLSQIGMLVWMQCIANKDRVILRERSAGRLTEEELVILTAALQVPLSEVPMRMSFSVTTTEADKTFEQLRMNLMTLTQMYSQYGQQTIPLAMQLFSQQGMMMKQQAPELWGYMARVLTGSGKMMEDMFKFFGTDNVSDYVPDTKQLDMMLDTIKGMSQSFAGAPAMQQGIPPEGMMPDPGMQQEVMPPPGGMA